MDKLQKARSVISEADAGMADLFVRRMEAVAQVAEYKKERGLPIFDGAREREVLEKGAARVSDPALQPHYVRFLQNTMEVSKAYQRQLLAEGYDQKREKECSGSGQRALTRTGRQTAADHIHS